ncbi:hypothetical protein DL765_007141 [Monosporascus sp. GIB2]|nr:hypothetical protein DL765_007141 [Monosporascus sp. GIB2]
MSTTNNFELLSGHHELDTNADQRVMLRFAVTVGNRQTIRYIEVDDSVYPEGWHLEQPTQVEFPPFPTGNWNMARLSRDPRSGQPYIWNATRMNLLGIDRDQLWHNRAIEYSHLVKHDADLKGDGETTDRLMLVSHPNNNERKMVLKIMALPKAIERDLITNEIRAYKAVEGLEIAPKFLGFVTEEGRPIGFLTEYIEGARHPRRDEEEACRQALKRFHRKTGLCHPDNNAGNFILKGDRVYIIDFETAGLPTDEHAFTRDLENFKYSFEVGNFSDEDGDEDEDNYDGYEDEEY